MAFVKAIKVTLGIATGLLIIITPLLVGGAVIAAKELKKIDVEKENDRLRWEKEASAEEQERRHSSFGESQVDESYKDGFVDVPS